MPGIGVDDGAKNQEIYHVTSKHTVSTEVQVTKMVSPTPPSWLPVIKCSADCTVFLGLGYGMNFEDDTLKSTGKGCQVVAPNKWREGKWSESLGRSWFDLLSHIRCRERRVTR